MLTKSDDSRGLRRRIQSDAMTLGEDEIREGLWRPVVSIICSLDTDIEPYRYVKHQLWRLDDGALNKRCSGVERDEFGFGPYDESLKDIYWTEDDRFLAETAIECGESFSRTKAVQYYLTLKRFLEPLKADLSNIPLYFNFVPREEFMELGPENAIFSTLAALHEKKFVKILSKLTRQQQPWIMTTSCPKCGESSKRVISSHLKGDARTVRAKCSPKVKRFRNEAGITVERRGCGHSFQFRIPDNPSDLYKFCRHNDFTVNFAVRELVIVIKTTADSPVCWPVTEIGVRRDHKDGLRKLSNLPKGFGDHLSLLTSMLVIQKLFVEGLIARPLSSDLMKQGVLTKREMLLMAYSLDNKLQDHEVTAESGGGRVHVKDTSALKMLEKGMSVEEFFRLSVHLYSFTTEELMKLRGVSTEQLLALANK